MANLIDGNVSKFASSEGVVWKYVFSCDNAVAEAVLYRYNDFYERTVICCSTMSGCPVGCTFCGTGNKFVRSLSVDEIVHQIDYVLKDNSIEDINYRGKRFQIMFMSMGEPMLNWDNVSDAIKLLNAKYPNAELLISTIGINSKSTMKNVIALSSKIDKIGLQFSVHRGFSSERNKLIPYKNKLSLKEIRDFGIQWHYATGRPVYINYCVTKENISNEELEILKSLFSPVVFYFTFSVVCSADESMKEAGFRDLDIVNSVAKKFLEDGYNTRVFNPAGQDDIGGGCGQLWKTQEWMEQHGYVHGYRGDTNE